MKATSLCLLTMITAALMSGGSHASARPDNNGQEIKPRTAQRKDGPGATGDRPLIHPLIRPKVMSPSRPDVVAKGLPKATPATPAAIHALAPTRPNPALNRAPSSRVSTHIDSIYKALPVRPGAQASPGIAASNVRHRDTNAAVIGGTATPNRTVTALDGSQVKLKSSRN